MLGSSSPAHSLQNSTSTTSSSMTSLSTMSLSVTSSSLLSETHQLDLQSAWYCSSAPRPAVVGVNRVWVSQQHRRTGVASRILDTIRCGCLKIVTYSFVFYFLLLFSHSISISPFCSLPSILSSMYVCIYFPPPIPL